MRKKPFVSVVIPVYNEERYLASCLDSLMLQTEPADEIIIVDNNSTDNTLNIAKKYPVKIVSEKKQGMTPARDKGYNEAKYEIIARTDADTIVPPTWIKQIRHSFKDKYLIALSGPATLYDLPELVQNTTSDTTWIKLMLGYNKIVRKLVKHDCLYGPNYAFRKKAWDEIKDLTCKDDKKVHEDIDLAIHIAPYGKIKFAQSLVVETSVRRWKKSDTYLEYIFRGLKSIQNHKKKQTKSKLFILQNILI